MIEVELPDGTIAEFPDGTPNETIKGALQKKFGKRQAAKEPASLREKFDALPAWRKPLQAADDIIRQTVDGITFGYGDKIAAKMNELTGLDSLSASDLVTGETPLSRERAKTAEAGERAGFAGTAANIAGSLLPVSKLMKAGVTAQAIPKMPRVPGAMMDGSAIGALNALGHDQDVTTGTAVGAAAGGGGDLIGRSLGKTATLLAEKGKIPSLEAITSKASKLYKSADDEGVVFSNDAAKAMLSDIEKKFAERTFEPLLQPGANRILKVLTERVKAGNPMTAEGIKALRSATHGQFLPGNESNNALLQIMRGSLDDFMSSPGGALTGDAAKAAGLRKEADALWSQKKKIETIRKALEMAENRAARTGSGGNLENTVKQELSKVIQNPRKSRGFTPDEKAMVDDVVYNQTGRDLLRVAGKLSPFRHGGAAALGAGGLMLEPITASLLMAGGAGSKLLGNAIQKSKAKQIEKLIAVGGKAENLPKPSPRTQAIIDALTRAITTGGALAPSH